jgi:sporulation protein YlmC with PRC-barrel domain
MKMAKITIQWVAVVFAFGFMFTNAFADEQMGTGMGKPFALSSMVGTSVLDPKGEYLGRASDFVIDSQGHVTFVVVSHGGFLRIGETEVAIPFGSFTYDRPKSHFVLDLTRDKLNTAPAFTKRDLYSEKWAEDVYRHFGQAPYWTEGELVEKGVKPMEEPISDFGGYFNPYEHTP